MTTKRAASKGVSGTTSILSPQATKVTKSTERRIKEQFFCPICEERIEEAVGKKTGHESVLCDGSCATWLHRRCAGLSKSAFATVSNSMSPFYCPRCRLDKHEKALATQEVEICFLKSSHKQDVSTLKDEIASLADMIKELKKSLPTQTNPSPVLPEASSNSSYASVLAKSASNTAPKATSTNKDRKYNILIYGLKECSEGTPRYKRTQEDLISAADILSFVDSKITELSIRDSFRLGRYRNDKHRPLLVKMTRVSDVTLILSNKKKLSSRPGISIKQDLSPEERASHSSLMKVRRTLIDEGTDPRDIKARGNALLVNGRRHGAIVNSVYQKYPMVSASICDPLITNTNCHISPPPVLGASLSPNEQPVPLRPISTNSHILITAPTVGESNVLNSRYSSSVSSMPLSSLPQHPKNASDLQTARSTDSCSQ